MTVTSYPLGQPRPATARGGDCRARDLGLGRNVHGPHRFATSGACQVSNGMIRLTVGSAGAAPSLAVSAWRPAVTVGDVFEDVFHDTFGGESSVPAWFSMGTLTIDSPSVAALLTAVRILRIGADALALRLVSPLMADAFVTLRRGEPFVRIQHGSTRVPLVDVDRRLRWTATPAPVGSARPGRVQESLPATTGMHRFVGAIDPVTVNASQFSLTAPSATTARFGAGVGATATASGPGALHAQLGDASRSQLVVEA